jgi:two-component system OmpR family response regulator
VPTGPRVLVVEDDPKLARALGRGLGEEGYDVETVGDGDTGLARATAGPFDVVVLDLMLPGTDGFEVCATLRRQGQTVPVLMLTARGDVADRIRGLDGGADDYLVKPFDFGELLARLRVLVRRSPEQPRAEVLAVGDLRVDHGTRVVTRAGRQVELTPREFDVFEFLLRHRGRLVTRAELVEAVWHESPGPSPNITDVYVGYLRKKLESGRGSSMIKTVRGRGFVLEPP